MCQEVCNLGPDCIPHQNMCSSGENIPVSGAPEESLSRRRLVNGDEFQNTAGLLNRALSKGKGRGIFVTPDGRAKHNMSGGGDVRQGSTNKRGQYTLEPMYRVDSNF